MAHTSPEVLKASFLNVSNDKLGLWHPLQLYIQYTNHSEEIKLTNYQKRNFIDWAVQPHPRRSYSETSLVVKDF